MATTCRIGLNLPVRQFPERAFDALRGHLDKEDETGKCDWRTLVTKLQLNEEQIESVRTSENKSKRALFFWQQNESVEDRNGRELVRVLYDMGRRDCAREIERFLGQRYKPESWQYEDILEAARVGDVNELAELIGDKTFPERAFDALRGYLDKEDETGKCDWRTLVTKLQLNEEQIESVRTSENKSKRALFFWQQNESDEDRNGRELVRVLYDMGRRDCAREIERFLGQRYKPESWQYEDILEAARMGDVSELAELIGDKTGSELEQKFSDMYQSPLHSAAFYGHLPAIKFLVEKGFDVFRKNHEQKTPREKAVDLEVLSFLEEQELKLANPEISYSVETSLLDRAAATGDIQTIKHLLENNSPVDQAAPAGSIIGWTPLHSASKNGHLQAVKLLVQNGADILKLDQDGYSAEDLARITEHTDVGYFLRQKREWLEQNRRGVHKELREKLLGTSITVYQEDNEKGPEEYLIETLDLHEIVDGIAKLLGSPVKCLKNKTNRAVVSEVKDLLFATDVLADTHDAEQELSQLEPMEAGADGNYNVYVQHMETYWSHSLKKLSFTLDEAYEDVLGRAKHLLGKPTECFYTSEKLSRIRNSAVLATKNRVIAARLKYKLKEQPGVLEPQVLGQLVSKEFTNEGGSLFSFRHGVLLTVPPGSVRDTDRVRITIKVQQSSMKMDLGREWGRLLPIGHPVLVQTEPRRYKFSKPVKLRIPHCGVYEPNKEDGGISVMTAGLLEEKHPTVFQRMASDQLKASDNYVLLHSLQLSWFWVFTESSVYSRQCAVSLYSPSDTEARENQEFDLKLAIYPNLHFFATCAAKQINKEDPEAGCVPRYQLKARKRIVVSSRGNITAAFCSNLSDEWRIRPNTQIMNFDDVWESLFLCKQNQPIYTVGSAWLGQADKNKLSFDVKVTLNGEDQSVCPSQVNVFIDLPGNGFAKNIAYPPHLSEDLIVKQLDAECGGVDEGGWRALAEDLGVFLNELDNSGKQIDQPTRTILQKFKERQGDLQELIDALIHLGLEF